MRRLLKLNAIGYLAGASALFLLVGYSIADPIASKTNASGTLVNGFRILTVEGSQHDTWSATNQPRRRGCFERHARRSARDEIPFLTTVPIVVQRSQ
jgi:hypothetical protein